MKNIKKIILGLFVIIMLFTITGCGEKNVEGSLEGIMEKVYAKVPEDNRPMALHNIEVTKENEANFLGTIDFEYEEAIASESQTGSIAHSVVLVRVKDTKDIEEKKNKIKETIDPRKWICVGIEREEVVVKSKGNLIIVIVVEDKDNRAKIEQEFDNL